jgi:hypothetical protein
MAQENPQSRGAEEDPKEQEPQLEAGEPKEEDAGPFSRET